MKIIAISDTHNSKRNESHKILQPQIELLYNENPNYVLIHSGDACYNGTYQEMENFIYWFGSFNFKNKIDNKINFFILFNLIKKVFYIIF